MEAPQPALESNQLGSRGSIPTLRIGWLRAYPMATAIIIPGLLAYIERTVPESRSLLGSLRCGVMMRDDRYLSVCGRPVWQPPPLVRSQKSEVRSSAEFTDQGLPIPADVKKIL